MSRAGLRGPLAAASAVFILISVVSTSFVTPNLGTSLGPKEAEVTFAGDFVPSSQATETLSPGQNVTNAVAAAPAGTAFVFQPGIYRMQSISPKAGDAFQGEPGAILSGARSLTNWTPVGPYWAAHGQYQHGPTAPVSDCAAGYSGCIYPEDLFVGDSPLIHVTSLANVTSGSWYFDYPNATIYLGQNPAGKDVETSVTRQAFLPTADNVTVEGLVVQMYAVPAQSCAIEANTVSDWSIRGNEVRWNHAGGICIGSGTVAYGNLVTDNGEEGIKATGTDAVYERNEVSDNNFAHFSMGFEAGGSKFYLNTGLVLDANYVHDNGGVGLWDDVGNWNLLNENNLVVNNSASGIQHEISFSATFRNNTALGNGYGYGGNIFISTSQNVSVYNNTIVSTNDSEHALFMIFQNRSSDGPDRALLNDHAFDNNITDLGTTGVRSGVSAPYNASQAFGGTNWFAGNHYHVLEPSQPLWAWNNSQLDFSQFQAAGEDRNGTVDTNAGVDLAAPHVAFASPSTGSAVSGTVTVTASASDPVGLDQVRFLLDGTVLGLPAFHAPWSVEWNASQASPGLHNLTVIAVSAFGSVTSASVLVTVGNGTSAPPGAGCQGPLCAIGIGGELGWFVFFVLVGAVAVVIAVVVLRRRRAPT